jgi:hypothetical protein
MAYFFPILAIVTFCLWFLLERGSWLSYLLISVILFGLTISATNLSFPFWKIYLPQIGLHFALILIPICLPIALFNGLALKKIVKIITNNKKRRKKFIFPLTFLTLGMLVFVFGFLHNFYLSIPINNLHSYLKHREYIVSLIKAGTLHGEENCVRNFHLYESECQEKIELPEEYKGLSRQGKIRLTKTPEQLSIYFTHTTYNFGEGSIYIVYSSFDNGLSKPLWEIK